MKRHFIIRCAATVLALFAPVGVPKNASAQTVSDEVRCVLLSNGFATGSKDPRARQLAASTGAYFMGRLDARQPAQVKAAIAGRKKQITPREAAASMGACVARAGRAEAQLRALDK